MEEPNQTQQPDNPRLLIDHIYPGEKYLGFEGKKWTQRIWGVLLCYAGLKGAAETAHMDFESIYWASVESVGSILLGAVLVLNSNQKKQE